MQEVSTASYWIASNALYITLNANGAPNYILGNTTSGAHILCYVKGVDGLEYDAAHNYRRWPLSLTPTKFNTNTEKYVYVAIPRPTNPETTAVVVFPNEKLDLYGKNEANQQIGSDLYYYVWLRGIITATNAGETLDREWQQHVETGTLSSDEAIDAGGDQTWWRYSSVDDTVTFLKEILMDPKSFFHNLKARLLVLAGHELTGVATAETSEEFVDSETLVVTPNYLRKMTEDKFLRKDQDDATPYSLSVGGDLTVSGTLRGIAGYFTSLFSNLLQSSNYTGDGAADTGFRLTADDGSGSSSMIVDVLHVRKKAIFEELEVKKEMSVAGNEVRSAAANIINRTDYINGQGEVIGYSYTRVPWMLRKMPFLLRGTFFGRLRKTRLVIDPQNVQNIQKIRCYFLAKDGDRDVQNLWQVGDLVRCQTFNLSQSKRYTYIDSATQNKPGNVFWWRKSVGVSTQTENIDGKDYHYVDVSMSDRWHTNTVDSDIPCAGDHMVQFGHDSNPDRMNLIVHEVNSSDAPAVKAYMGIYTYDESECWWGGAPRKMMLSPKSGYEFYGPSFKFIQEYGQAPASIDRGVYTEIATERDDYAPHNQVRKLYYYDKVSHNGCYWLCVMTGVGAHWVAKVAFTETVGGTTYTFSAGDYIPDNVYSGLVTNKTNCTRKENYTTEAPSETSTSWKKLVNSGDNMIRLDIDNELDAVQTDSTGKVTAQRTITTNVRLYDGATEVAINNPTVTGISYTDANGQQQTLNPVITASGNGKQLSWTFQAGWTMQARYQVNISYTYLDVPYNVVFTLTASQGFEVLQLKPSLSAIIFQRDASNQLTPASRTLGLSIVKIDGASTADITPATYGVSKIRYSLTEMPALISSGSAWPAAGTITVPNTAENVYIALFNIFDVLIDRETVPVIKDGEKGAKGDSVSYDSEHSSIGYAYSSMGTPESGRDYPSDITSWSPTPPAVQKGKYLWTKDVTAYNNAGTIVYTTTYGVQYQPNDGESVEIDSSRTFIKYCRQTKSQYTGQHPADSDFSTTYPTNLGQGDYLWILNQVAYVGVANPLKSYSVSMLGTDGGKGDKGADGYTTHFAYATSADGSQNFSTTNFNGATYIGTYRDQQAADSTDYRDYVWTAWKGDKGDKGDQGSQGPQGPQGPQGSNGNDGYTVICEPASLVINQGAGNVYDISTTTPAYFKPKVTKGTDTTNLVTAVSVSANYCVKNNRVAIVDAGTWSSANGLPVTGVYATAITNKYTQGYLVLEITADSKTFSITIPIAVNYLSSYIETIVDGKKTEIARETVTIIKDDGTFVENNAEYESVKTAAGDYETWSSEGNTQEGSKRWMNEHISTAEGNISTVTKKVNDGKNLLKLTSGWEGYQGAAVSYDGKNFGVRNANGNLYSPVFLGVEGETYCFSVYLASGNQLSGNPGYCYDSVRPTHASELDDNGTYQSASFIEVTGDTITIRNTTYQRYYFLIPGSVVKERYFTIYNDGNYWFYCPQLEVGNYPTEFSAGSIETSSQIKQTADEIEAKVNNTGVDITNGKIKAITNKFEIWNEDGTVQTFSVDQNGNLVGSGDASFNGVIKASSLYLKYHEITNAELDENNEYHIDPSTAAAFGVPSILQGKVILPRADLYPFMTLTFYNYLPTFTAQSISNIWACKWTGPLGAEHQDMIYVHSELCNSSYQDRNYCHGFKPVHNMVIKLHSIDGHWCLDCDESNLELFYCANNGVDEVWKKRNENYVDDWGYQKIRNTNEYSYQQFNFVYGETISGTNDIVLPQHTSANPIPDGTTYYVKGNGSSRVWSYTPIMNSHNSSDWPQTNSYYANIIHGQSHIFLMQTVNGRKVWIDFYASAQVSPD